ncbi:MAG: SAM-dependent methyltransferase [Thermoplasmata archaeon]
MRFDRYMEVALYGEGVGYYARSDRTPFGPEGDFYTAAHVHPLFARALARRLRSEFDRLGRPPTFRIVEVGAGDGTLGAGLLAALAPHVPPGRRWDYLWVERSAARREELARRRFESSVTDRFDVSVEESIVATGPFRGAVVGNELLDALPCRRFVWRSGRWAELGVRLGEDGLDWAEVANPSPVPPPTLPGGRREGAVIEVGVGAEAFLREVADHLAEGCAIFLDYGASERELIDGHPSGTLSAVRRHTQLSDLLDHPGDADLSVFVNFTRIRSAARTAGLHGTAFRRQSDALVAWGFPDLVAEARDSAQGDEGRLRVDLAAKSLLFGFENFHVLELAAGPAPPDATAAPDSDPRPAPSGPPR